MDQILKALVATTCGAILMFFGWMAWSAWSIGQATQLAADRAADTARIERLAENAQDCRPIVRAWDAGDRGPAVALYKSAAESSVRLCRMTIELYEFERSR